MEKVFVNKEKGTVAYVKDADVSIMSIVFERCTNKTIKKLRDSLDYLEYSSFGPNYKLLQKFVGVAKCSPKDEFDENTGKKIAKLKWKKKYYKESLKRINMIIADFYSVFKELSHLADEYSKYIEKIDEKLNQYN
jgi:hypothetical protein